jgi:hypothetical protein
MIRQDCRPQRNQFGEWKAIPKSSATNPKIAEKKAKNMDANPSVINISTSPHFHI